MTPDAINAAFEVAAAIFVWLNFVTLKRDRLLRGIHWLPMAVFVVWGYWNPFYYSFLEQWLSAIAAVGVALGNTAWLWLFWHIKNGDKVVITKVLGVCECGYCKFLRSGGIERRKS